MAELQIYVQKHNVKINSELVDDIKLKVVMETLRNEMEARKQEMRLMEKNSIERS